MRAALIIVIGSGVALCLIAYVVLHIAYQADRWERELLTYDPTPADDEVETVRVLPIIDLPLGSKEDA